jgi:formylglycine-generating enzyme required for sulfatase activity
MFKTTLLHFINSRRFLTAIAVAISLCVLVESDPSARSVIQERQDRVLKHEQGEQKDPQRVALIIGNGAYTHAPALKNPRNDASLVAATLRKLGFKVTTGTDKSQREMKKLIREFGEQLRGGGIVGLFYFAGHGVQARGHNYLIPVDAEIQSEADIEDVAVDVNYVLNVMDGAQNGLNIVILDACRNNPFPRSFRSAQEGLAQVKAPTGTMIAYATAPDSVAADGAGANSPYTEELARQMQTPGVFLETMFRRVAEQVSLRSGGRQEPWFSANVKGDFFFNESPTNLSLSKPLARIDAVAVEREYWETIRSSTDPQNYLEYLQAYPTGAYAAVARAKIRQLEAAKNSKTAVSVPTSFTSRQGIEMVYIPPGRFMMGSDSFESGKPVHEVAIAQGFYMEKYEVTQSQWKAVMGQNPSRFRGDNLPVEMVSWDDAMAFIARLNAQRDGYNYRLPTEAEWEYACRAGTSRDYAGDPDGIAWYANNSGQLHLDAAEIFLTDPHNYEKRIADNRGQTHPVGSKLPNSFGLFDMLGNVAEWCQDWYHPSYHGAPIDGSAWLSGGEQQTRVLRGGSWHFSVAGSMRPAAREANASPNSRVDFIGFRVVAVLAQ